MLLLGCGANIYRGPFSAEYSNKLLIAYLSHDWLHSFRIKWGTSSFLKQDPRQVATSKMQDLIAACGLKSFSLLPWDLWSKPCGWLESLTLVPVWKRFYFKTDWFSDFILELNRKTRHIRTIIKLFTMCQLDWYTSKMDGVTIFEVWLFFDCTELKYQLQIMPQQLFTLCCVIFRLWLILNLYIFLSYKCQWKQTYMGWIS